MTRSSYQASRIESHSLATSSKNCFTCAASILGERTRRCRSGQLVLASVSIMELDRWLGIELRHLAALQAIAHERSFHAAAARLGYSQSAVSQQIATLERIVGGKLIERPGGPRTVFLTDLGELVLRHAEAIVARLQAAQADAEAMVGGDLGALRVGSYQSVGEQILPALVPRFQADHAGVEISLIESESDDALLTGIETATGKPRRRPSFSLRASSAPNSNVGLSRSSRPPADTALIARHGCGAG